MDELNLNWDSNTLFKMVETSKDTLAGKIEDYLKSDLIVFDCPIGRASFERFGSVLNETHTKSKWNNDSLGIIINTNGGKPEYVSQLVQLIRQLYTNVIFIVYECALSSGTLFCFSGNKLYMNNTSYLGALDLQITEFKSSWELTKKHVDRILSKVPKEIRDDFCKGMEYDINNKIHTNVRVDAKKYLTTYHQWDGISEEAREKLLLLPDILTDNELMKANGIKDHEFPIVISHAKSLGLNVRNYQEKDVELYDLINKLYDTIIAENLLKQSYKIPPEFNFIYSRNSRNNRRFEMMDTTVDNNDGAIDYIDKESVCRYPKPAHFIAWSIRQK